MYQCIFVRRVVRSTWFNLRYLLQLFGNCGGDACPVIAVVVLGELVVCITFIPMIVTRVLGARPKVRLRVFNYGVHNFLLSRLNDLLVI